MKLEDLDIVTSVRLAGESTIATFKRELERCKKESCELIMIPVGDLAKLLKVAEAAKASRWTAECPELKDALEDL